MVASLPQYGVGTLVADRAYDSYQLRDALTAVGIDTVIPPRKSNTKPVSFDVGLYRARHAVENAFADLKHMKRVAMRSCKLAVTFLALAKLAAWYVSTTPGHRKPSPHKPTGSQPTLGGRDRQLGLWQRERSPPS